MNILQNRSTENLYTHFTLSNSFQKHVLFMKQVLIKQFDSAGRWRPVADRGGKYTRNIFGFLKMYRTEERASSYNKGSYM
jgi:hypothetical protein